MQQCLYILGSIYFFFIGKSTLGLVNSCFFSRTSVNSRLRALGGQPHIWGGRGNVRCYDDEKVIALKNLGDLRILGEFLTRR